MAIPRIKHNRSTERRKIELAVKYREQGKATGGGRITAKKVAGRLEARNLPLQRAPKHPQAGHKQRRGRRRST
jgi:hypothetical protein